MFYVQSSRVDAKTINLAISEFFASVPKILASINTEEFRKVQQSLTQQLTEPDSTLRARSQRLWSAITQQDHDFSRLNRIAEAMQELTYDSFTDRAKQLFNKSSHQMFLSASPASFDSTQ